MNIAFQSALHDHSAGSDVGFNTSVRTDGQPVSFRVDRAFHLAIYIKVFVARDFPFNRNGLADEGHFRGSMRWLRRLHELSLLGKLLLGVIRDDVWSDGVKPFWKPLCAHLG